MTHMVIRVVVEANSAQSAVSAATAYFQENLEYPGGHFDYCTPMEPGHTISGTDRWAEYEDLDVALPLASQAGQDEVEDAWGATTFWMKQNATEVWDQIEDMESKEDFTDAILNEEGLFQHRLSKMAGYSSTDFFLYVQGWNTTGVSTRRGMEFVDELIEDEEAADEPSRWVVPLDVHY